MNYVLRSMTTSDYDYRRPLTPVVPYHIYLLPPEKRRRAYWTRFVGEAMKFASPQEAEAEERRSLSDVRANVMPERDGEYPTYWDLQKM